MEYNNIKRRKSEIRAGLKKIRAAIPPETRKSHSENIARLLLNLEDIISVQTIFIYISYGSEVDTHTLIEYFLKEGKILAVPKIINSDHMIATRFTRWEDLTPGQLGILTPAGNDPYDGGIDIVITPGLGFTQEGYRLGYGRGYYDQWFAGHKAIKKIALAYEAQVINEIPVREKDIPVDMIVTETRVIKTTKNSNLE